VAVPYLPLDPADVGREYEIRVNSQSGSSAAAFILESKYGIVLPKPLQRDFGPRMIAASDRRGEVLPPEDIFALFCDTYVNLTAPLMLHTWTETLSGETSHLLGTLTFRDADHAFSGTGNGMLDAFCHAVQTVTNAAFIVQHYSQAALETESKPEENLGSKLGSKAMAISYVAIECADGKVVFGAGMSSNIATSALRAVVSAVNRV